MGQQSWQAAGKGGRKISRRVVRLAATLGLVTLLIGFFFLLLTPFSQPRANFCLLTATPQHLLGEPRVEYLAEDLAAFESVAQGLARRGAARRAVKLENLHSREEVPTLTADLERALGNPADVLILYVATAGVVDHGTPFVLCGNFEAGQAEAGRYPLRRLLAHISECQAAVKLLILDAGRVTYDPRLGSVANDFPRLLRDEVQRLQDSTLWVLSANTDRERSHVSRALARSVFGYYVTQGLQGAADLNGDTMVDLSELQRYVTSQVGVLVRATSQGLATQTPELLWGGGSSPRAAASTLLVRVGRTKRIPESQRLTEALASASQSARVTAYQGLTIPSPLPDADAATGRAKPPSRPAGSASSASSAPAGTTARPAPAAASGAGASSGAATGSAAAATPGAAADAPAPPAAAAAAGKPAQAPASKAEPAEAKTKPADAAQDKAAAKSAAGPSQPAAKGADAKSAPTATSPAKSKPADAATDEEAAAPAEPSASSRHVAELLVTAWQLRDALELRAERRATPGTLAPHLWRELQERLLRYDQQFRAGPVGDEQALAEEVEDLVTALRQIVAGEPIVSGRGGAVVAQLARLQLRPGPAFESVWSLALAEELAASHGTSLPAELQACGVALDGFLTDGEEAKFKAWTAEKLPAEFERYSELRFAKQLAAVPQIPWADRRLALRVRREGERAAARARSGLPWVQARLETADRLRLQAERGFGDRVGPLWQAPARQALESALEQYLTASSELDLVRTASHQIARLAGRVPAYLQWQQAAGPDPRPGVPTPEMLAAFLSDLTDAWRILEQPDPAQLPKLRRLVGQLADHRQQLEAGLQDVALAELSQSPGEPFRIESLLKTALPRASQRCRLLQSAAEIESRRLARAVFPEIPETIATAPAPTYRDWQRWLKQTRLEAQVCRLVAFQPGVDKPADDPVGVTAARVVQAVQKLEQVLAGPECETAGPPALADVGTALGEFYRLLPRSIQNRAAAAGDLAAASTRDARLKILRAALRAERFVDARDASALATLNLEDQLQQAGDYDWLVWQHARALQARDDAPAEDTRYQTEVARAYRQLAAGIPGQPAIAEDAPAQVKLAGPTTASLTNTPQASLPITLNNLAGDPARVWLILHYDALVLDVAAEAGVPIYPLSAIASRAAGSESAAELSLYRPDLAGLPPTLSLDGGESEFVRLRVTRKGPASGLARLIVKALAVTAEGSAVAYVRHPVDIDVPNSEGVELQVAGTSGTWSQTEGKLALFPFANQTTKFQFRLANPVPQAKAVDVQWLTSEHLAGLAVPRGSLSPAESAAFLARLEPTTVVVPSIPATLPAGGSIPLPFPPLAPAAAPSKPPGAAPAGGAAPAAAPPPAATAAETPLPANLLMLVTERETRRQTFRLLEVRPQRPRRFLRPQVGYEPQRERIAILLKALDAQLLPAEPLPIQVHILGATLSGNPIDLEGNLDPLHPELRLSANVPAARDRVATVEISVGGYPRAFVYEVPCWALATDIPEKKDLMSIRITGLPRGRQYKTPAGPIPVEVRVDAPVGAFENGEDEVRVGVDINRDRELAGDPAVNLRTDRQVRLFLDGLTPGGEFAVRAVVGDFLVTVPPPGARSARVNVLAELAVAGRSVWSEPVELVLDGTPPRVFQPRLKSGPEFPAGTKELELSVLASDDELSGVAQVEAAFDVRETGSFAPDAKLLPAVLNSVTGTWDFKIPVAALLPGSYRLLLRPTDAVGNVGDYTIINVRVVPPPPPPTQDGKSPQILGRVTYGQEPQAGVEVLFKGAPGTEIPRATTDAEGKFVLPKLAPGKYKVSARALLHNRPRTADAEFEVPAAPAAPKPLELQLR